MTRSVIFQKVWWRASPNRRYEVPSHSCGCWVYPGALSCRVQAMFPSGCYAWVTRSESPCAARNRWLAAEIRVILRVAKDLWHPPASGVGNHELLADHGLTASNSQRGTDGQWCCGNLLPYAKNRTGASLTGSGPRRSQAGHFRMDRRIL